VVDAPRRGFDPAALAVIGVATALMVAIGGYLAVSLWLHKPPPPPQKVAAQKPPPKPVPAAPQLRKVPADVPVPSQAIAMHGAGQTWRYRVTVEPPLWRDATLAYRIIDQRGEKLVDTDFQYAGGNMKFRLGTFAAGHPSHASTRFPGFFMYVAYLDQPLDEGRTVGWEWPWQLPGGQVRPGRIKRYVGQVKAWENLSMPPSAKAPANMLSTARIEGTLLYIEDGVQRAAAAETLWYAPRFLQVVKIVHEGRTPDEEAHRIVAELVGYEYP
jgi:hypothetical protein